MAEFKYNEKSKSSGIYRITNVQNSRAYYGSCKCFQVRWHQHLKHLEKNRHSNKFLQADFNKCGTISFVFEIVEVMENSTKEERLLREENGYLKTYFDNGKQCYNLCDRAISREGHSAKDPKETKRKISENSKKLWSDPEWKAIQTGKIKQATSDPKTKEQRRQRAKKSWEESPERRENMAKAIEVLMADPDHRTKLNDNLNVGRPKTHEIVRNRLQNDSKFKETYTSNGKRLSKFFQEKYENDPNFKEKILKQSIENIQAFNKINLENLSIKPALLAPDGTIFSDIKNLNEFAKIHGLDASSLYKLCKGTAKRVRGWKLAI